MTTAQIAQPIAFESLLQYAIKLTAQATRNRASLDARLHRAFGEKELPEVDLQLVCDCLAKEHGYDDWDSMSRWLTEPPADSDQADSWLALQLLQGLSSDSVSQSGSKHDTNEQSLGVRLAKLDATVSLDDVISAGVNEPMAPLSVPALVYVCCSKHGANEPTLRALRRSWVRQLLAAGANPSDGMRESDTIRGYRTCLGGAIGFAQDPEIASQLLAAGADIADGPTLYEGSAMWEAIRLCDHESLDLLLKADPPEWHVCHALTHCMQFHDISLVEKLLAAGADPNWDKTVFGMNGNALHEAIQCDCSVEVIKTLIEHKASVAAKDGGGRSPLTIATALGRSDLAAYLLSVGASEDLTPFHQFVGACFQSDEQAANELRQRENIKATSYHDQLWLHESIKRGARKTFDLLTQIEFNLDSIDYQGETPLHRAVTMHDEHAVKRLLDLQASTSNLNFDGDTAIDLALRLAPSRNDYVVELLSSSVSSAQFAQRGARLRPADVEDFEAAVDAVAEGNIEALRELLDRHPYFNVARSNRPHKCALVSYLGVNGFEGERQKSPLNAVDVIKLLLDRGCDPNVLCYTYRGGPGEGMLGLLLSSGVVESPQQRIAMVRTMTKGGATIDASYQLLFELLDAKDANTIESTVKDLELADSAAQGLLGELVNLHEFEVIEALQDVGVDINARNGLNQTVLHWTALNGDRQAVDWLLAHGADLTIEEDQYGGSPIGWADAGGHQDLVQHLVNRLRENQ